MLITEILIGVGLALQVFNNVLQLLEQIEINKRLAKGFDRFEGKLDELILHLADRVKSEI